MAYPPSSKKKNETLATALSVARTAVHWGFIPTLLYLGFKKRAEPGMPPLCWQSLLWQ